MSMGTRLPEISRQARNDDSDRLEMTKRQARNDGGDKLETTYMGDYDMEISFGVISLDG